MGLSMFFLGCYAMVVQMLVMREMLSAFSGNELTIGATFGVWFIAISAGALAGRTIARSWSSNWLRVLVASLLLGLALLPPILLIILVRSREWLDLPVYAGLPFDRLIRMLVLILTPLCLAQGAVFPCACRLASEGKRQGVSRLYGFESLGGLAGGLGFGAAMTLGMAAPSAALAASALGFAALAASLLTPVRRLAAAALALAFGLIPFLFHAHLANATLALEVRRWESASDRSVTVAARVESPYQRLTVVRMGAQSMLYGNSQPFFMFPDPVQAEPLVHGVLARHPGPRSVLLIGGNPADLGRALLAHPGVRVTYVETDPWIWRLTADAEFIRASRGRFRVSNLDPVWFAREGAGEAYDVILLFAPEPETVGLNRFYTVEFYRSLRRLLKPDGFLWTSVEASEQLQAETGLLAASVCRTLDKVFPSVVVTFGSRLSFYASNRSGGVPVDREALAAEAARAGVRSEYFKPEQFLSDESVDPVKMAATRKALDDMMAPVNTLSHPVTHTFMLLRWNRFSDSRLDRVLWALIRLDGLRLAEVLSGALLVAALLLITGLFGFRTRRRQFLVLGLLRFAMAMAGFTAIALELILIFLAQSLFGYVYERLAFIVALFMAGLAAGAFLVKRFETAEPNVAWSLSVAACTLPVLLGMLLPVWLEAGLVHRALAEWVLHGCMVVAGASIGILFPMINRLLRERGDALTEAAGSTHAADNIGAALGALLVGLVLIPVLGIGLACFVVALANTMLALCMATAKQTG